MWGQSQVAHAAKTIQKDFEVWVEQVHPSLLQCLEQLDNIILDKTTQNRLALTCLLAGGHLLIEDLPGLGKTTLAHAMSKLSGLKYQRIQFTNDMLASDIIGVNIFNQQIQKFEFKQGPVFTQILLADEINRSSPKTQSALLEAMEERQVSVDSLRYDLPKPFWVIATQNPHEQSGTYVLPESQLDRFLMRISMGYPTRAAELMLLQQDSRQHMLQTLSSILNTALILELQEAVSKIYVSDHMLNYILDLTEKTRSTMSGLSTRGVLALKKAAQACALLNGRAFVIPEDIQEVFVSVVAHRVSQSPQQVDLWLKQVQVI